MKKPVVMPTFEHERKLFDDGYKLIAGVDEAGRGPLAGPVVAAAVIFDNAPPIDGINDSKKLTPKKRQMLYEAIKETAVAVSVGIVDVDVIERVNILNATFVAMKEALYSLSPFPSFAIVDGNYEIPGLLIPQRAIIRGDGACLSIAAASIIAKVTRDSIMDEYSRAYPEYGFDRHKGYGTKAHIEAIKRLGTCPIHRLSFLKKITYDDD